MFFIRRVWADYLDSLDIRYIFFSAVLAQEKLDKEQLKVTAVDNINTPEFQDDNNDENKSTTKLLVEKVIKFS